MFYACFYVYFLFVSVAVVKQRPLVALNFRLSMLLVLDRLYLCDQKVRSHSDRISKCKTENDVQHGSFTGIVMCSHSTFIL